MLTQALEAFQVSLASQGEEQPPTITYTNVKELYQVIRQVPGDFLIVQSIYHLA